MTSFSVVALMNPPSTEFNNELNKELSTVHGKRIDRVTIVDSIVAKGSEIIYTMILDDILHDNGNDIVVKDVFDSRIKESENDQLNMICKSTDYIGLIDSGYSLVYEFHYSGGSLAARVKYNSKSCKKIAR